MQLMKPDFSQSNSPSKLSEMAGKPSVTVPSSASGSLTPPGLDSDLGDEPVSEEEAWSYDEPSCNWQPLGKQAQDCGEGVVCPPCD
jgi:hypothetical protein